MGGASGRVVVRSRARLACAGSYLVIISKRFVDSLFIVYIYEV